MCTHHAHNWSRKKGPGNASPNSHAKVTLLMRCNLQCPVYLAIPASNDTARQRRSMRPERRSKWHGEITCRVAPKPTLKNGARMRPTMLQNTRVGTAKASTGFSMPWSRVFDVPCRRSPLSCPNHNRPLLHRRGGGDIGSMTSAPFRRTSPGMGRIFPVQNSHRVSTRATEALLPPRRF